MVKCSVCVSAKGSNQFWRGLKTWIEKTVMNLMDSPVCCQQLARFWVSFFVIVVFKFTNSVLCIILQCGWTCILSRKREERLDSILNQRTDIWHMLELLFFFFLQLQKLYNFLNVSCASDRHLTFQNCSFKFWCFSMTVICRRYLAVFTTRVIIIIDCTWNLFLSLNDCFYCYFCAPICLSVCDS